MTVPTSITGRTRLFLLLGRPVAHSLSPALHNRAFAAHRLDAAYLALSCEADAVPTLMRATAGAGGGGNITVPHKVRAAEALDRATDAVRLTGACNTFWMEEGALCGDNTDVLGFARAAESMLDGPLRDRAVLVLGAGGAARAVVLALLKEGAGRVSLRNRSLDRAKALAERMGGGIEIVSPASDDPIDHDLVVNATALGLDIADPLPLRPSNFPAGAVALDLVYRPDGRPTAWVRALREAGHRAQDGRRMLLEQAAEAFSRWYPGIDARPPMHAVVEAD